MANQSPDRREVLALLAKIGAVSQFAGFSRWVCAAEHTHGEAPPPNRTPYSLQFFTPAEYQTLEQAVEQIIPSDDGPGAKEAGVAEFIDFMVAHNEEIQYSFRTGLAWLDAFATEKHGDNFAHLPAAQQEELLRKLAYHDRQSPTEIQGQEFFKLLREYTVMGFYTSRVGLQQLDYPGLKLYASSPECSHHDDPEHRHLSPTRS